MIQRFRKKAVEVEGVLWNGNTAKAEIEAFVGTSLRTELESEPAYVAGQGPPLFALIIPTLEGDMRAMPGDYILKGVKGECYPCKPDILELTYDRIETTKSKCEDCSGKNNTALCMEFDCKDK